MEYRKIGDNYYTWYSPDAQSGSEAASRLPVIALFLNLIKIANVPALLFSKPIPHDCDGCSGGNDQENRPRLKDLSACKGMMIPAKNCKPKRNKNRLRRII